MKPMTARWIGIGLGVALLACWLAVACESSGGGSTCFPAEHGPSDPSCAGFDLGLTCPVDLTPWYSCTCTAADAGAQAWMCGMAGATDTGGMGTGGMGTGGMGAGGQVPMGSGGGGSATTGDAGSD